MVSGQESIPIDIDFNSNGTKMYVVGWDGNDINEYTLSTAFDVSTASFENSFSVSSEDTDPAALAFSSDGTKMFVVVALVKMLMNIHYLVTMVLLIVLIQQFQKMF